MTKTKLMKSLAALLLCVALLASCIPVLAENPTGPNTFMVVSTGNKGKLHLRQSASTTAPSLGLYTNGTTVYVESASNGWAYVLVEGQHGYMSTQFLKNIGSGTGTGTVMYVQTGNNGRLHLRANPTITSNSKGLYNNGTKVTVLKMAGEWAYVNVNGRTGYMMFKYLSFNGTVTPDPVVPVVDPSKAVAMVVKTGNAGRLNLRETPSTEARSLGLYANGTLVQAVSVGNGWSWVSVGGKTGYMMSQFLAYPGSVDPTPSTPYTMYIRTGNAGRLNLRALPSTDSTSLGLYANDTAVTVLATTGLWANVAVDGKIGFMLLKFLTSTVPGGVAPIVTNMAIVKQPSNSFVNLRSSMAISANNILAQVPTGAVVEIVTWGTVWSRVRYNELEGFMVSEFLFR